MDVSLESTDSVQCSPAPSGTELTVSRSGIHILVGVTGSVAALKLPLLVSGFLQIPGVQVQVVSTEKAKHFYNVQDIAVPLCSDQDEWTTCVVRAWDLQKPLLFCPAMNTAMWNHPITEQQILHLRSFGYTEIPCIAKKLMCGDEGLGAMAEVSTILEKVKEVLKERHLLV
ncbi:hypothetical protein XELAEV_18018095mg [Xenopus laevis]|uniref:Flavoprotein domain-containing protein n=1 Tax=Xenopus laevis TaxID=8355 RepID=A0A974DCW5_XENLA|nr:hypothetical protein XELAEV_18018095mg [Xenopus laevis]